MAAAGIEQEGTSGVSGQKQLWKTIWSAEVPNKIRNFVWRACQNIIPTKSNLCRRQVLSSDTCEQCGKCSETTSHILLHCDKSSSVWVACGLVMERDCSFVDLLWKVRKDLGPADVNLTHFMAISWNIWNDRNGVRHGEVPKTVSNLVLEAIHIVEEYKALQDCHIPATNPLPTLWIPPIPSAYKANVDGVVFNALSTASLGVLTRDDKGRVVGAMSQNFHAPLGPLEAEAKAMEAAVLFARDLGIQDITFEGDSLQVYNFLARSTGVPLVVANVLEGIRFHLQFFRSFAFSHVKRAGNKPAHLLAQHAKFVSSYEVWVEETPSFLETVIASDAFGL